MTDDTTASDDQVSDDAATTSAATDAAATTDTTVNSTDQVSADDDDAFDKDRALRTIRKLREEAKAATRAIKERDTLKAERQALEDAKLSEQDRLTKRAADLEAQLANEQRASRDRDNRYQVQLLAGRMNLVDPEAAEKLLPWDDVDFDESGHPTNLEEVLKDLVKARPYLQGQTASEPRQTSSPTNGASRAASTGARIYTSAEIADYPFYLKNREDIILAGKEGRILP